MNVFLLVGTWKQLYDQSYTMLNGIWNLPSNLNRIIVHENLPHTVTFCEYKTCDDISNFRWIFFLLLCCKFSSYEGYF